MCGPAFASGAPTKTVLPDTAAEAYTPPSGGRKRQATLPVAASTARKAPAVGSVCKQQADGGRVRSKGANVTEAEGAGTHGVLAVAPREDQLVRAVAEHRRGTVDDPAEGHVP